MKGFVEFDMTEETKTADIIKLKPEIDFMAVRRRLSKCADPIEVENEIKKIHAENEVTLSVIRKCARELEREKKERIKFGEDDNKEKKDFAIPLQLNSKGKPYPIVHNAIQVLRLDPRWQGVLRFNLFSASAHFAKPPPFSDTKADKWEARDIKDTDDTLTAAWMQQHFILHVPSGIAAEAINAVALDDSFNPIKDYLEGVAWDETKRLDYWLNDYFGVEKNKYTLAVAAKTLISAVARIYEPAAKVDTVLTLIGDQGIGKSTAWKILAYPWFSDSIIDLHSKDAMQHLRGRWIVELSELSAMQRQEIEATKQFLSRDNDGYRPTYGRRDQSFPRQCIFVATTNTEKPLKDRTGNRRWWPVAVTHALDADALRAVRDQLWAEAVTRYKSGEKWYLDGAVEADAEQEQHDRVEEDDWQEKIAAWLTANSHLLRVPVFDVYEEILGLKINEITILAQRRVAGIMRHLGWIRKTMRHPITNHPCGGFSKND